jgi:hypothetical protein
MLFTLYDGPSSTPKQNSFLFIYNVNNLLWNAWGGHIYIYIYICVCVCVCVCVKFLFQPVQYVALKQCLFQHQTTRGLFWSCTEFLLCCTCAGRLGLDQLAHSPCTWIIHASEQYRTRTTKSCHLYWMRFITLTLSHPKRPYGCVL